MTTQVEGLQVDPKLAAALVRVQRRASGVAKASKNEHHRYQYTSSEDMLLKIGGLLAEEGVAIVRTEQVIGPWVMQACGTKSKPTATVSSTFLLVHETGAALSISNDVPAVADAGRPADKAVLGTSTEALAYAIRDVATVARGSRDIIEPSARNDTEQQTPRHATQPGRERRSSPPQQPSDAAAGGDGPAGYEGLVYFIDYLRIRDAFNAYMRAKAADPDKAQTLNTIRSWAPAEKFDEQQMLISNALPDDHEMTKAGVLKATRDWLSKALGRKWEAAEMSALMQRIRDVAPELDERNHVIACCLLAARCARKPETLHLRLGLPKAGEQ